MQFEGHLGGSVGETANSGSGHDLAACEFEPRVGLCADSSEPGSLLRILCLPLSVPPLLTYCLSLSLSKINIKKIFLKEVRVISCGYYSLELWSWLNFCTYR